jgi:hypothetical protein
VATGSVTRRDNNGRVKPRGRFTTALEAPDIEMLATKSARRDVAFGVVTCTGPDALTEAESRLAGLLRYRKRKRPGTVKAAYPTLRHAYHRMLEEHAQRVSALRQLAMDHEVFDTKSACDAAFREWCTERAVTER